MVRIFPYAATQFTTFEIYKKVSLSYFYCILFKSYAWELVLWPFRIIYFLASWRQLTTAQINTLPLTLPSHRNESVPIETFLTYCLNRIWNSFLFKSFNPSLPFSSNNLYLDKTIQPIEFKFVVPFRV